PTARARSERRLLLAPLTSAVLHPGEPKGMLLHPQAREVLVRWGRVVQCWDLTSRSAEVLFAQESRILCLAYSRDGAMLAVADAGGGVRLWDVRDRRGGRGGGLGERARPARRLPPRP